MRNRDELRHRWIAWMREREHWFKAWQEGGYRQPITPMAFPEELRGVECGAMTRAGTPCQRKDLGRGGRCKLHGGASTGPRTEKGRKRVAANLPGTC